MEPWRKTIIVILAALTVVIVLQNLERVDTRILFFTISMPRALLLTLTALAGFAVGMLTALKRR